MSRKAGRRRLRALLVVLACVALLGACIVERKPGIHLHNDLEEPVEIVYLTDPEVVVGRLGTEEPDDGETFDFGLKLDPGAPPDAKTCTTADIVARALDGRVLARIRPPVCWDGTLMLLSSSSVDGTRGTGIHIFNDLGEPVEIVYLVGPEVVAGRLGTGEGEDREVFDFGLGPNLDAVPPYARCTTADIVARALDGRVLARIPPPACEGGTTIGLSWFRVRQSPTEDATPRSSRVRGRLIERDLPPGDRDLRASPSPVRSLTIDWLDLTLEETG